MTWFAHRTLDLREVKVDLKLIVSGRARKIPANPAEKVYLTCFEGSMRSCVIGRVRKEETKFDFVKKEENLVRSKDKAVINENESQLELFQAESKMGLQEKTEM